MLHVTYGTDRAAQKDYIDKIKSDNSEHSVLYIERGDFARDSFEQTVFGRDLFEKNYIIVLDGVCETKENREYITKNAIDLKSSSNIVVLQEQKLDMDFLEPLKSFSIKIKQFSAPALGMDFSLWSAIYKHDKKTAWQAYIVSSKTEPPEKLHASILSQVRSMYKVKISPKGADWKSLGFSAGSSYAAAARGSANYTEKELGSMMYELTLMNNLAHSGEADFDLSLEALLLKYL